MSTNGRELMHSPINALKNSSYQFSIPQLFTSLYAPQSYPIYNLSNTIYA